MSIPSSLPVQIMLTTPLSDEEYDQLDDMLLDIGEQAMDVSALEGLLTALVVGPSQVPQAAWLAKVWGGEQAADTVAATGLALRHLEYMRKWMAQDPGSFEPIYECGGAWSAEAWTAGFETGMELDNEGWAPLRAAHPEWFAPLQREGCPVRHPDQRPLASRTGQGRQGRPQRSLPLRQRQEIQEVLRRR
jgi:uncharacterized protein